MTMPYFAAYLAATVVMALVDMLWLGWLAKPLYAQGIGHLMAEAPRLGPAIVFYLLYPAGLMFFAVLPGPAAAPDAWRSTLVHAALFGLVAYATYDLSNLATLRNWPLSLAAIDMAWGTAISMVAASAAKLVLDRWGS